MPLIFTTNLKPTATRENAVESTNFCSLQNGGDVVRHVSRGGEKMTTESHWLFNVVCYVK